jgi:hypothetical protein
MSSLGDGRGSGSGNSCRSLEAMGFSKTAAQQALAETNGNVEASINLLLEREGRQRQQFESVSSEHAAAAAFNSAGSPALDIGLPPSCSAPAPSHIKHEYSPPTSAISIPSLLLKTSQFASVPAPPDILCDLAFTCEIMDDPVIAVRFKSAAAQSALPADTHRRHSHTYILQADGHTYDRAAIESWLQGHETSPRTGEELSHKMLLPNRAIRHVLYSNHIMQFCNPLLNGSFYRQTLNSHFPKGATDTLAGEQRSASADV